MHRKLVFCIILALGFNLLYSQQLSKKDFIKAVQEADAYFYFEQDYEKAADNYKPLADSFTDNANLAAKLGISYLNVDGKKAEALAYLKKAVRNIVSNDNDYTEYGDAAPLDTYLYLAIAYQQNDSLEKALNLFTEAKRKLSGYDIFSIEYINNQIRNSQYAIDAIKRAFAAETDLFIPWLKNYPGAMNPVLSGNDSVFVFTQKTHGKTKIFCSYKNDVWKNPSDITDQLGGITRYYTNSITGDGKMLLIYMDDGDDGNLYYSIRRDSSWSKIRSLGKEINTVYWEAHGFITPDGQTLYFSSNRPGGKGELDIWKSVLGNKGKWEEPINCGNVINTRFNENTPFFDQNRNILLFSSSGHTSMGGYDVFRSVWKNGKWTLPAGLPYPINKTTDDSFLIYNTTDTCYISSFFDEKAGYRNIFSIRPASPSDKRITAEGTITTQDGQAIDYARSNILLTDARTGIPLRSMTAVDPGSYRLLVKPGEFRILISQIGAKTDTISIKPEIESDVEYKEKQQLGDTGMYSFVVSPGDYILYIRQPGYKTDTVTLNLPEGEPGSMIHINTSLVPEIVSRHRFLFVRSILFDFDSYNLDDAARANLDLLRSALQDHPGLKIEIAGFTDSRGKDDYNFRLAGNRADAVIDYLAGTGIEKTRMIRKVIGNNDYAAVNTNSDGSDNPEGRKYNRRTTIGIVDPNTGVTLNFESFTPRYLRHPSSFRYSIVLIKSEKELTPASFKSLEMPASLFINPVKIGSETSYIVGEFYSKTDAVKYLTHVRSKGFTDASIITQYDTQARAPETDAADHLVNVEKETRVYTIQLAAARKPVQMSFFKDIEGVRELYSEGDKYYRYITGSYPSVAKAKPVVTGLKEAGFKDAFIRNMNTIPK